MKSYITLVLVSLALSVNAGILGSFRVRPSYGGIDYGYGAGLNQYGVNQNRLVPGRWSAPGYDQMHLPNSYDPAIVNYNPYVGGNSYYPYIAPRVSASDQSAFSNSGAAAFQNSGLTSSHFDQQ